VDSASCEVSRADIRDDCDNGGAFDGDSGSTLPAVRHIDATLVAWLRARAAFLSTLQAGSEAEMQLPWTES